MANNLIQIKRTSVSGRAANSTTLQNPGELAINMTDGIMYSTNGSVVFEIGANNTNASVSGTLTVNTVSANSSLGSLGQVLTSNGSGVYWSNVVSSGSTAYNKVSFTATAGQTTFSVTYTVGYVDVWLNGVKLVGTTDYTATNGTSIVLTSAAALNDNVEVIAWNTTTFTDGTLTDVTLIGSVTEEIFSLTDAATVDIDPADGTIQTLTLTGTGRTLTFTNMANGQAITLMVNDGTAGTITTWNATFVNNGGSAPTLATTGYTVVSVWKVGGTVYAALVGDGT